MANDYRKTQVSPLRQLVMLGFTLAAVWGVISMLKKLPSHPAAPAVSQSQQSAAIGSKIGGLLSGVSNPFAAKQQPVCSKETAPAAAKGFAPQPQGFELQSEEDAKFSLRDRIARHYSE